PTSAVLSSSCSLQNPTGRIEVTAMTGATVSWSPRPDGVNAKCAPGTSCRALYEANHGQYVITVTDTFGCVNTLLDTIEALTGDYFEEDTTINAQCADSPSGQIRVRFKSAFPVGGDYYWTNEADEVLLTGDTALVGVLPGQYRLHVTEPGD